jgi:tetratricopeptide (TPR) repeat protein
VDYYAGEYGVAMAAFERFLESQPAAPTDPAEFIDPSDLPNLADQATALFYRAMILRDQGDVLGAVDGFDRVIQGYPEQTLWDEAWEEKAYTQWAYLEDYISASATLLEFVQASPGHPRAAEFLSAAARVAERDQRLEEAAHTWERIPDEYGSSELVFDAIFQAGIALSPGNFAKALLILPLRRGVPWTSSSARKPASGPARHRLRWGIALLLKPPGSIPPSWTRLGITANGRTTCWLTASHSPRPRFSTWASTCLPSAARLKHGCARLSPSPRRLTSPVRGVWWATNVSYAAQSCGNWVNFGRRSSVLNPCAWSMRTTPPRPTA